MIFLRRNQMLTSKAHRRVADEVDDLVKSEIYNLSLRDKDIQRSLGL